MLTVLELFAQKTPSYIDTVTCSVNDFIYSISHFLQQEINFLGIMVGGLCRDGYLLVLHYLVYVSSRKCCSSNYVTMTKKLKHSKLIIYLSKLIISKDTKQIY